MPRRSAPPRRLAARLLDPLVVGQEGRAVDLLAPEVFAVARIADPDLPEHLADDDLDVLSLIVTPWRRYTSGLGRSGTRTAPRGPRISRISWRIGSTFREVLALVHNVARLDDDVLARRDQMLLFLLGFLVLDDKLALAANGPLEGDDAGRCAPSRRHPSGAGLRRARPRAGGRP